MDSNKSQTMTPPGGAGAPIDPPRRRHPFLKALFLSVALFILVVLILSFFGAVVTQALFGGGMTRPAGEPIGLLRIEGIILQGSKMRFWVESLERMARDEAIRGVVVRIDSPGGSVGASQELYETLVWLREHSGKTVWVSMGDVAASGGYYIASAAERIYALNGTLTGSIGVLFKRPEISELSRKIGIRTETVASGVYKDGGAIDRPMREDEREIVELVIDDTYNQFMEDILRFRSGTIESACGAIPPEKWTGLQLQSPTDRTAAAYLERIADGRVYTGRQALELGLIDEILPLERVIESMAGQLGVQGQPRVYEPERQPGLREMLFTQLNAILPTSESPIQYLMDL